jgi:hypothetical protein
VRAATATLTWDATPTATEYHVYRGSLPCSDPGPLQPLPGAPIITAPTYIDATIPDGVANVCYEVTASNAGGESLRSVRVGKTFAVGAVTFSKTSITFTAIVGDVGAQVPLVTVTNGMNVPITVSWSDPMQELSNSVPAGVSTIAAGASLAYTIRYTPAAVAGTTTSIGTMTVTPQGGVAKQTNFTVTSTVTAKAPVPPVPTNLKVTQLDGDHVLVAFAPKDCVGGVTNVRSGPATAKLITITCVH